MSTAQKYAEGIIATLRMIDEVDSDWWQDDVQTTADRLREAAAVDPDESTRLEAMASWLEDEFDARDDDMGLSYLNSALDTWAEVEWRYRNTDVTGARVLVTAGGPHAEIVYRGDGDEVLVEVNWGGDTWRQTVECAPLAQALSIVMENADMALVA